MIIGVAGKVRVAPHRRKGLVVVLVACAACVAATSGYVWRGRDLHAMSGAEAAHSLTMETGAARRASSISVLQREAAKDIAAIVEASHGSGESKDAACAALAQLRKLLEER